MISKLTRADIIEGFHKMYLANVQRETKLHGRLSGIPVERLKAVFNETIADYVEHILREN